MRMEAAPEYMFQGPLPFCKKFLYMRFYNKGEIEMNGMMITLFKEPVTTDESRKDFPEDNILWMHYDTIKIKAVNDFKQFFLNEGDQTLEKCHEGDMQSLQLYFIKNEDMRLEQSLKIKERETVDDSYIFYTEKNGEEKIYAFAGIITLKFNHFNSVTDKYELKEKSIFRETILEIIDTVNNKLMDINSEEFVYDWYGSLGTEELVLIVNTDKIKTFSEILKTMRLDKEIKEKLSSTYSFIFSNYRKIENGRGSIEGVSAGISLTVNPAGNIIGYFEELFNRIGQSLEIDNPGIITELENAKSISEKQHVLERKTGIKIYNMIGKYDYHIIIPKDTWNFLKEYNREGIFNIKNDLYSNSIFQIKTNWLIDDISSSIGDLDSAGIKRNEFTDDSVTLEDIEKQITKLKESVPEYLKRASHIMHAIELLYIDFKKNMKTIFAKEWRQDLKYQFETFLKLLENGKGEDGQEEEKDPKVQFQIIEETLNSIRQTYIHITQASRMFFEIPATNLRYTGSYNKILRAYYGIVKQLCYIAYSVPKQSKQSLLIPIITFEYTPKVNTHIYTQTTTVDDERLVVFHLPYEALIDIPKYTRYLAHEIYHYIAPFNRKERNKKLFKISLYYYYQEFIVELLIMYVKNKFPEVTETEFKSLIYSYVVKNYGIILEFIDKELKYNIDDEKVFEEQPMKFYVNSVITELFKDNNEQLIRSYNPFVKFWAKESRAFNYNDATSIEQATSKKGQRISELSEMDIQRLFKFSDETLFDILKNSDPEKINITLKERYSFKYKNLVDGLKEAQCDYFLIQICQLNLEKYLKIVFDFLYENSVVEKIIEMFKEDNSMNSSFWCRVGIIISLFERNGKIDKVKKELEKMELPKEDERGSIFEQFKEYIINCYKMYMENFDLFSDDIIALLNEESLWNCKNDNVRKSIEDIYSYSYRYDENIDKIEMFRLNIKMMEQFQSNLSIETLRMTIKKAKIHGESDAEGPIIAKKKWPEMKHDKFTMKVHDMSEYIKEVDEISKRLKMSENGNEKANVLWYRGQTNSEYILLPGLLRNWDNSRRVSPLEYEAGLMNIFCSKSTHMRETDMLQMNSTFDWIVLMQHYGIPTNLLDWSENAFVALFFALVKENNKVTKNDAAVYILNPEYMEVARQAMVKEAPLDQLRRRLYPINNLSIGYNSEMYTDFLPYEISESIEVKANKWHEDDTGMSNEWWSRPIVSSLSNSRIRAQYGAFTISNLMARPCSTSQNGYDYLSIERMQDKFIEMYPDSNLFLYKIIIDNKSAEKMKGELESLGYKYMNVYPELEKASDSINKQVENYLFK